MSLATVYELALRGARPLLRAASPLSPKLARGVRGRAAAVARIEAWAAHQRRADRALVWLHAPSVGEALMAQAITTVLHQKGESAPQVVFTWFSPSAERVAGRVGADYTGYLPWDVRSEMRRAVAALRPDVVAFVRTEIWPVLMGVAAVAGARTALVNAALSPGSSRLRMPARAFLSTWYRRLDAVGAVAPEDAALLRRLGVPPDRTLVTGDARFDQVVGRLAGATGAARLRAQLGPAPVLVAGSTWPADEALLIRAFVRMRAAGRTLRLVVAPHEPTEAHLTALERALRQAGVAATRLAAVDGSRSAVDAIIVDRLGVLADLYAIADAAFVGGGFGRHGLHSVVEPAALGVPVVFGARVGNAREALALAHEGGGSIVAGEAGLFETLDGWFADGERRAAAGAAARRFVQRRLGGAARNAAVIERLLG